MEQISIVIQESPIINSGTPYIDDLTDLVGNGFHFTKRAMGGFVTASMDFMADEPTAWLIMNSYLGKQAVFRTPYAKNGAMTCWEGCIYTVRLEVNGVTISRSIADVYNDVRVSYAELLGTTSGSAKITAAATDAASIGLYGRRQLVTSAGSMTTNDATYLRDVLLNQYRYALSSATATNKRGVSAGDIATARNVKVGIDCVGWWEFLDKTIHSQTATSSVSLDTIIKDILSTVNNVNNGILSSDVSLIQSNAILRTEYFNPAQPITAAGAMELICALGDGSSAFGWIAGVGAGRQPYYRVMNFAQKYVTRARDGNGEIYDAVTGELVRPELVEPGYLIAIEDMFASELIYADGAQEARNQMIDEVTFTAPDALSWNPRLAADLVNLKLSRLASGYYDMGFIDLYFPDIPPPASLPVDDNAPHSGNLPPDAVVIKPLQP